MGIGLRSHGRQSRPAHSLRARTVPDMVHRGSEAFLCAGIVQALAAIEAEYAKPTLRQRSRREIIVRSAQNISTNLLTALA